MASTYTWRNVLNFLSKDFPRVHETAFGSMYANLIQTQLWDFADWRVSVGKIPVFSPIAGEQDLVSPMVCIPSDFSGFRKCQLLNLGSDPASEREVTALKEVDITSVEGMTKNISYVPNESLFRLFPRFPASLDCSDFAFHCHYKKLPVKLDPDSLDTTTIPWDDKYINAILMVGNYAVASSSPARAKEVPLLAQIAQLALEEMASAEGLDLGQTTIHPAQDLTGFDAWVR